MLSKKSKSEYITSDGNFVCDWKREAIGFNLFIARTKLLKCSQLSESSRKKQLIVEFS